MRRPHLIAAALAPLAWAAICAGAMALIFTLDAIKYGGLQ